MSNPAMDQHAFNPGGSRNTPDQILNCDHAFDVCRSGEKWISTKRTFFLCTILPPGVSSLRLKQTSAVATSILKSTPQVYQPTSLALTLEICSCRDKSLVEFGPNLGPSSFDWQCCDSFASLVLLKSQKVVGVVRITGQIALHFNHVGDPHLADAFEAGEMRGALTEKKNMRKATVLIIRSLSYRVPECPHFNFLL